MSGQEMVQATKAQLDRLAALEEKEAKTLLHARKAAVKSALLAEKAKKAGFTVSEAEIKAKMDEQNAKKVAEAAPATVTEED